ncbi:DNA-binding transcriptional ArsR family regulator [Sinorhizobium kostiense]|uniref:DNA-binding transcriptional ArsR family regulator n=1 Tax=Sinorhizobium kostiense TaxID=76747 RepID=A0ABS4QY86_9HYPH|nr:metalloregulator ArsR/SmtB family transcription factor [Sinorhizobium kostiense]MBP2234975.1 DNA-binding transcriptional ArsR family regulator [Sinorhizobium kostiense]
MISDLDDTLLALADSTRRRIFEVLLAGETAAADIAMAVGVRRDELSRHIVILEEAGLVSRRRQGERELVAANPAPLEIAADWINTNRELWAMRSQMQEEPSAGAPNGAQ